MTLVDRTAPRSGEFFAPLPLAALALLVTNDVWLKRAFHNELTGKLSDVAVCFLMPLFVSELLGLSLAVAPKVRLGVGALVTVVLFTLLEVVPPVTERTLALLTWLGPSLGLHGRFAMTPDVTDLLCVPLVFVAYRYGLLRLRSDPQLLRSPWMVEVLHEGSDRLGAHAALAVPGARRRLFRVGVVRRDVGQPLG